MFRADAYNQPNVHVPPRPSHRGGWGGHAMSDEPDSTWEDSSEDQSGGPGMPMWQLWLILFVGIAIMVRCG